MILFGFAIIVMAFVAWEIGGMTAGLPIHTISYYSQHDEPLAIGIGAAFPIGGVVGLVLWIRHMRSRILK